MNSEANDATVFSGHDAEILSRINYAIAALFTALAQENRYYYATKATLPSGAGSSGRVLDLTGLNPLLERMLLVKLPTGDVLNVVDLQDVDAELSPRAYPLGQTLVEVGNEWSGTAGPVTLSLWYAYRPAEVNVAGALSQVLTVADRFCEYLEWDLAWWMASRDFGRGATADQSELQRLEAKRQEAYSRVAQSIDQFAGVQTVRYLLPVPRMGTKQ